jgi:hypothetical protein
VWDLVAVPLWDAAVWRWLNDHFPGAVEGPDKEPNGGIEVYRYAVRLPDGRRLLRVSEKIEWDFKDKPDVITEALDKEDVEQRIRSGQRPFLRTDPQAPNNLIVVDWD